MPRAAAASAESFDHCRPRQPLRVLALTICPSSKRNRLFSDMRRLCQFLHVKGHINNTIYIFCYLSIRFLEILLSGRTLDMFLPNYGHLSDLAERGIIPGLSVHPVTSYADIICLGPSESADCFRNGRRAVNGHCPECTEITSQAVLDLIARRFLILPPFHGHLSRRAVRDR